MESTTQSLTIILLLLIIIIGVLVLSSSVTEERDNLWMVDSDLFPFQTALMESHVSLSSNSVAF